jgi:hypothetical protein
MERPEIAYHEIDEYNASDAFCNKCRKPGRIGETMTVLGLDGDVELYCESCTSDVSPFVVRDDVTECRHCDAELTAGTVAWEDAKFAYCGHRCHDNAQESAYVSKCESDIAWGA